MRSAVMAVVLLVAAVVQADQQQDKAKMAFEKGSQAFELGRFDDAIRLFEEAYQLSRRPALLWNVAKAHRAQFEIDHDVSHLRRTKAVYRNFAELSTMEAEKQEAIREEAAVDAQLAKLEDGATTPAPTKPDPTAVATPARPEPAKPTQVTPAMSPSPPLEARPSPDKPVTQTPVYKKWWLWTMVGGVVVAGAAVGLGLALSGGSNDAPIPPGSTHITF